MIYYVDSVLGNDEFDGTSRQSAFKTLDKINSMTLKGGDVVRLKAECIFRGNLTPKRENDEGVITFERYGAGKKPLIYPYEGSGVDLQDFSFAHVHDLAVRNPNGRCGIFVHTEKGGCIRHIEICNCEINDVLGNWLEYIPRSGGIIFSAFSQEPGWFEDVLVEDNCINNVCRSGIYMTSYWVNRPKRTWGKNEYVSDTEGFWPSRNVVIRGNHVKRTGGDGIVVIGSISPLLEWNILEEGMYNPPKDTFNAGLWVQATNDAVLQYNEVGHMHLPDGCTDGQGYDVDLSCKNTLVQYNYSHDNEGGFILLCETMTTDEDHDFTGTVVRNNVSVNDGRKKGELIAVVGPVKGTSVENNTFYSSGTVARAVEFFTHDGKRYGKDIKFVNNIFMMDGEGNEFNMAGADQSTITFDNNVYCGKHCGVPATHTNVHVVDPLLKKAGATGKGRTVADNYVPAADSPVHTIGVKTESMNGVDFTGHNTDGNSMPYVGAFK